MPSDLGGYSRNGEHEELTVSNADPGREKTTPDNSPSGTYCMPYDRTERDDRHAL
jgi:hypothetical protein